MSDVELLALRDLTLSDVARIVSGRLVGDDIAIRHLRPLSADPVPASSLTYAGGGFVGEFLSKPFASAIVSDPDQPTGRPLVVHPAPARAFFSLHRHLAENGVYPVFETRRGAGAKISPSATVHEGTILGTDVVIGDNAVVMPNTILGDGVRVQAGTVVGEPGFQVAEDESGRYLVPHTGGVHLADGVSIGANCAIDRALLSTFTTLGPETMLDNLVHVAHDVRIGARCTLTASVELSGSVELADDVWLAPRTCCNQFIRFGRGAYTGTGSVVVRDVAPFTLVLGSPAKPGGRVCLCRTKLPAVEGTVGCSSCGRVVDLDAGMIIGGKVAA